MTVATEETDGFKQFMRSAKKYDLKVKVCCSFQFTFLKDRYMCGELIIDVLVPNQPLLMFLFLSGFRHGRGVEGR